MLDGAALVTGGAVASVHFRELTDELTGLTILGWLFLAAAFGWLALTSAGPFVFLVRRFSSRPIGYPSPDDWLWLAVGLPWLLTALYRSACGTSFDPTNSIYGTCLFLGLFAASGLSLLRILRTWSSIGEGERDGGSWTDLVGRVLSVTWPLQLGLGFVVTR
jgi:hypothetical protein